MNTNQNQADSLDMGKVVAVVYNRLCHFELGIVVEIFGRRRPQLKSWYRFEVTSVDPPPLMAGNGMSLWAPEGLATLEDAGTIVIPGWRDPEEPPPANLLAALRRAHERGARLLSVCSGVFVLAATGLLDGLRATTHWRYSEQLARLYPQIRVDPGVLYVDEGTLLTSAGSAAGIDLCLHLIRRDLGASTANVVARRLVVPPHREGGQAQFIDVSVPDDGALLARLMESLRSRLGHRHSVESLAREVSMSPRTFARRFKEATGTTPHRWLVQERLHLAQQLLEATDLDVDQVSQQVGMGSSQVLRLHFRRRLATTPTAYRRAFRARES